MQRRIPFHGGLFLNAMIGFMERPPDRKFYAGSDGHYSLTWAVDDKTTVQKLEQARNIFRQWLDMFEVTYSACNLDIRDEEFYDHEAKRAVVRKALVIHINHPVDRKES